MANYDEIITQANDHRTFLLENAEQQRLVQSIMTQSRLSPRPANALHGLVDLVNLLRRSVRWGRPWA